jgi:transposase
VPNENRTGYGPRLTATIAELSGTYGCSRETIKDLCQNILSFHISTGAIQKVIDRSSKALLPAYNRIGDEAKQAVVNYIDETSWLQCGLLSWLWAMVNDKTAFFKIHQNRNMAAFKELIDDWNGILVSDGYGVYKKWAGARQTCLAHMIREARNLAERNDESIRRFGENIHDVLRQLVRFSHKPPSQKKWTDCYSRLILFILLFEGADDDAGKLARRLSREMDHLFTFLEEENVDPTNNRAERAIRFGVLWRKRSMGTQSDKGTLGRDDSFSQENVQIKRHPFFPYPLSPG